MEVTIKMIAPKAIGCQHIKVEYSDGVNVLTRVYHVNELKELALADVEPALKQIVAKTVIEGLAVAKATLTSVCCKKAVTL